MKPVQRHQLVFLRPGAWCQAQARCAPAADVESFESLALRHWADHGLPLVVTRQACDWAAGSLNHALALGLALPNVWGRGRLRVDVRLADVAGTRSFPSLEAVSSLLPPLAREAALRLRASLADLGVEAEVYGGYGWERLTGLAYLRPGSDLDLLLRVATLRQADAAAAALHASGIESPRLDGELVFPDGSAVAWREWAIWRAGWVDRVLVKRLDGPALVRAEHWSAWRDAQDEGVFCSEVSA